MSEPRWRCPICGHSAGTPACRAECEAEGRQPASEPASELIGAAEMVLDAYDNGGDMMDALWRLRGALAALAAARGDAA